MASLQEVIPQFLNPDNNARQAAELIFAQHKANPPVFATQLLELARTLPEPQMRQMCAVLLRRNLDTTFWPAVGAQGQQAVKAGLLEGVVAETQPNIRKALADTISKLAGIAASTGGAPNWMRVASACALCASREHGELPRALDPTRRSARCRHPPPSIAR
jgi:hypothetical protein